MYKFLMILALTAFAEDSVVESSENPNRFMPGAKFTGAGYIDKSGCFFGEGDLMLPIIVNDNMNLFAQGRLLAFQDGSFEGNIGGGIRGVFGRMMLGVYGFFDRKKSSYKHFFNQLTFGAEFKTCKYSLTGNAYFPINTTLYEIKTGQGAPFAAMLVDAPQTGFKNIELFFDETFLQEGAFKGFDGEIGKLFFDALEIFAGGYYFHRSGFKTITGPMARAVLYLGEVFRFNKNAVQLEGYISYDDVRKTQGYVGLRISVLLGENLKKKRCIQKRLFDRVRRDLNIVAETKQYTQPAIEYYLNSQNEPALVKLVYSQTDFLDGLPAADIMGINGTIVYNGGGSVQFKDGQTITGGTFAVTPTLSLQLGSMASLQSQGGSFILGRNNTFSQLEIIRDTSGDTLSNNGTSLGKLSIDQCLFRVQLGACLGLSITDGSTDSVFNVTNSIFSGSYQGIVVNRAFPGTGSGAISFDNISHNTFANIEDPIRIIATTTAPKGGSINNNTINFTQSDVTAIAIINGWKITNISHNTITFAAGTNQNSDGIVFDSIIPGASPLTVRNIIGNKIRYMNPSTGNAAIHVIANQTVILGQGGGVKQNVIIYDSSGPPFPDYGFQFYTNIAQGVIDVYVGDGPNTLSEANSISGATKDVFISGAGKTTITPN